MTTTGSAFNWRGFWADFLNGSGRGLLELDGSREAEAALSGLDFFEAARRRRRAREIAARGLEGRVEAPPYMPEEAGRDDAAGMRHSPADLGNAAATVPGSYDTVQEGYRDPRGYDRMAAMAAGLAPSVRAAPLSANPYDHPGLPIQLALGHRGYQPVARRR